MCVSFAVWSVCYGCVSVYCMYLCMSVVLVMCVVFVVCVVGVCNGDVWVGDVYVCVLVGWLSGVFFVCVGV